MDPIIATIIGGLLWLFLGSIVAVVIYLVGAAISGFVTRELNGKTVVGIFISWLLAVLWQLFVLFNVIVHVVRLIQLATGATETV